MTDPEKHNALKKAGLTPEQLIDKKTAADGDEEQRQVYLIHFLDNTGKPFMQTIVEDEAELKDKMDNIFMHKDTVAMLVRKIYRLPS